LADVTYLVRISTAPKARVPFVAGLLMSEDNRCVDAAPILRYHGFIGKDGWTLSAYCQQRGWQAEWLG